MCLILFAHRVHPRYPLIVAANRDEFYERPTERARFWEDHPDIYGGRDLVHGGTWMGITRAGRFAAVTNYREKKVPDDHQGPRAQGHLSRGIMVADFLMGTDDPGRFASQAAATGSSYGGYNLLVRDTESFWYCSNRNRGPVSLDPGIYGLSNHLLDSPWPKVERSKARFREVIGAGENVDPEGLIEILMDRSRAADGDLPDTGFGITWERILSPPFIVSPTYGTRSSTVVLLDSGGSVTYVERVFTKPTDQGVQAGITF